MVQAAKRKSHHSYLSCIREKSTRAIESEAQGSTACRTWVDLAKTEFCSCGFIFRLAVGSEVREGGY